MRRSDPKSKAKKSISTCPGPSATQLLRNKRTGSLFEAQIIIMTFVGWLYSVYALLSDPRCALPALLHML